MGPNEEMVESLVHSLTIPTKRERGTKGIGTNKRLTKKDSMLYAS